MKKIIISITIQFIFSQNVGIGVEIFPENAKVPILSVKRPDSIFVYNYKTNTKVFSESSDLNIIFSKQGLYFGIIEGTLETIWIYNYDGELIKKWDHPKYGNRFIISDLNGTIIIYNAIEGDFGSNIYVYNPDDIENPKIINLQQDVNWAEFNFKPDLTLNGTRLTISITGDRTDYITKHGASLLCFELPSVKKLWTQNFTEQLEIDETKIIRLDHKISATGKYIFCSMEFAKSWKEQDDQPTHYRAYVLGKHGESIHKFNEVIVSIRNVTINETKDILSFNAHLGQRSGIYLVNLLTGEIMEHNDHLRMY